VGEYTMSNLSPLAITLHQCHAVGGWERVAAEVEGMRVDALREAASLCQNAATRLLSNGRARVNQIDRHTAEVLSAMGKRIAALPPPPADRDARV
jgi:hypothetical protein